jgi:hypothetical protein
MASTYSWLPELAADVVNVQQTRSCLSGERGMPLMLHDICVLVPVVSV